MGEPATKSGVAGAVMAYTADRDAHGDRVTPRQGDPEYRSLQEQIGDLREDLRENRRDVKDLRKEVWEGLRDAADERKRSEERAAAERKQIEERAAADRDAAREELAQAISGLRSEILPQLEDIREAVRNILARDRTVRERRVDLRRFVVSAAVGFVLLVIGALLRPILERVGAALFGG